MLQLILGQLIDGSADRLVDPKKEMATDFLALSKASNRMLESRLLSCGANNTPHRNKPGTSRPRRESSSTLSTLVRDIGKTGERVMNYRARRGKVG